MKKAVSKKAPACSCGVLELPKDTYHCKDCHGGEGSACQLMRKANPGWKCFPQTAREAKEVEEDKVAERIAKFVKKTYGARGVAADILSGAWREEK